MTTVSYPAKGTGGMDIADWSEHLQAGDGIVNDYTGNSCNLTRVDASNLAQIAAGKVRVGGYILEITATHDLTVSTSAATYYIFAKYDPAANVAGGGGAATAAGPCTLEISSGPPSEAGGVQTTLLYQIVRSAAQALTAATVTDYRVWCGINLHIPAASTIPASVLTDPVSAPTGFGPYPVGTRLVWGSGLEYTLIKSTSGLLWQAATLTPVQNIYTSGTTWTKPTGARWIFAEAQAGGGAGGGAQSTGAGEDSAGAGGQGGGYAASLLAASAVTATVAVTVGAAGVAASGGSGGNGGTSSFGSYVSATGGDGGTASGSSGSPVATSGAQATQTFAGQIQRTGGGGGALIRLGGGQGGVGGTGGNSQLGSGGGGRGGSNAGLNGTGNGGGGGGGANAASGSAKAGGAASAGVVRVTTYF